MIISKTPLRVSFAGGGTDFPDYYEKFGGMVVSSAITPSIYVILKERFDRDIYVGYSKTEIVGHWKYVQHDLVRECLRMARIAHGVEIKILADIPSEGCGLGSSSALTVGLLNALYTYKQFPISAEKLARDACSVEIDILGKPIGKQDQYISAYGGLRWFQFEETGNVWVGGSLMRDDFYGELARRELSERLMLFYTGKGRKSEDILTEQKGNIPDRIDILHKMKAEAELTWKCFVEDDGGRLDLLGDRLHMGWYLKRQMSSNITNPEIDEIYERALNAGAEGGKICGAGGGGFILLDCPVEKKEQVRVALGDLMELPFELERYGSRIIFNGE